MRSIIEQVIGTGLPAACRHLYGMVSPILSPTTKLGLLQVSRMYRNMYRFLYRCSASTAM